MSLCETCGEQASKKCSRCHKVRYCKQICQRKDWVRHKSNCGPFEMRESPGKGFGLFATRDLDIGDLIVQEEPILYIEGGTDRLLRNPEVLRKAFEGLDESNRDRILSLADAQSNHFVRLFRVKVPKEGDFQWERVFNRFCNNCIVANNYLDSAIYGTIARINHSCSPNVEWSYVKKNSRSKEVRAFRKIRCGEEILADYIAESGKFAVARKREALLQLKFGFTCRCSLCSSDCSQNDAMRQRLQQLSKVMEKNCSVNPKCAVSAAFEKCQILRTSVCEDLVHELPMAYLELYEVLLWHKIRAAGIDNDITIDGLENDPDFYRDLSWRLIQKTRLAHSKVAFSNKINYLSKVQTQSRVQSKLKIKF